MKIKKFRGYTLFEQELKVLEELEWFVKYKNLDNLPKLQAIAEWLAKSNKDFKEDDLRLQFSIINNHVNSIYKEDFWEKTLPESISNLINLERIAFGKGNITSLPNSICNLPFLKELNLPSQKLTTLPESIGELSSLRVLNLESNKLTTLPESIGELSSLQVLNLESNKLTTLPESIGDLSSLQVLRLASNKLTTLPESIGNLKSLQILNLGFNKKDEFWYLKDIKPDKNQLTNLPKSIKNLHNLQTLDLESNQLKNLPEFIGNLTSLKVLNLESNQLISLPESIGNLTSLQKLNLKSNKLMALPESFHQMRNLKTIVVEGNKWKSEWKDIVKLDIKSILKLCRKLYGLFIFISHAWLDQKQYNVIEIKNRLENKITILENDIRKNIIHDVFICEEDVIDDIQEFMKIYVPKCDLLIFIATNNSLASKACQFELSLAKKNGIKILPIKGRDILWEDLSQINLTKFDQEFLDLSNPKEKYEFNNNFNELCNDLCQYIASHELELKKKDKLKNLSEEIAEDIRNNILKIINSIEFINVMRKNIQNFKKIFQEINKRKITKIEFFSKLAEIFNTGSKLSPKKLKILDNLEKKNTELITQEKISKLDQKEVEALNDLEKLLQKPIPHVKKVDNETFGVKIDGGNVLELGLYNKWLKSLPESIGNLKNLQILELGSNNLITLPKSIMKLQSLEILNLSSNGLTTLPEIIFNLISLKSLNLSNNGFTTLPDLIGNLTSLKELDLSSNKLTTLPESIGKLKSILRIFLNSNEFKILPDSIGKLSSLKDLKLNYNPLVTLPDSIGNLLLLENLDIFKNKLKFLPDSIGNLKSLKNLNLISNELTNFPDSIGNLKSLEELHAFSNKITNLPDSISNLTSLKLLRLNSNKLASLPKSIGNLQSLQKLSLQSNQLVSLSGSLWKCTNLEELLLNDNAWNEEWKGIENRTIPTVLELCKQRAPINISIIFTLDDEEKYSINALSMNLERYEEIKNVYKNKEDKILESQLVLFIATRNSILNEQCKYQLGLVFTHNISIIPIKGVDLSWEDLTQINTEIGFDLSDKLGFEFKSEKISEFFDDLYNHIKKFKRNIDVFESEEKRFEEEWNKFIILIKNFIISKEFTSGIKENIEQFKKLLQEFNDDQITQSLYLIKLAQMLNPESIPKSKDKIQPKKKPRYCKKCGHIVTRNFCTQCGTKLD